MVKIEKILYVLVLISVISVIIAVIMFVVGQREEMRRREAEKKLAQIIQEKEVIQSKLEETQAIKQKLQEDLKKAKQKTQHLSKRLEEVESDMEQLKEKLTQQTRIAKRLRDQLEQEKTKSESLSEELKVVQKRKQELEKEFESLKNKKESLESELVESDEKMKVQLDKIVVTPQQDLDARVLVVNQEYNFIISNLGQDSVLKGTLLGIYRGNELIARARVSKIYPNMCSAEILNKIMPIREGDEVEILK